MTMSVFRAFIAVDISVEIAAHLTRVIDEFKLKIGAGVVRWSPVENIHLTLKFLGDVSVANVEMLTSILEKMAASYPPFEISIGGCGAFPNDRRPRVIWIGVEAPPELTLIQRAIDLETARLGYEIEPKGFSPHLTLGRVSRQAVGKDVHTISQVLKTIKVGFLGITPVSQLHLYRSDLRSEGAIYTRIYSASLGGHENNL